jgi:hypothetical protein
MTIIPPKLSTLQWAPRPAPFLPGLHSIQATHSDDQTPFVSVYRQKAKEAEKWIRSSPVATSHTSFFLRSDEQDVKLYDHRGSFVKNLTTPSFKSTPDSEESIPTDRDQMIHEARKILKNRRLSLLACAEDHASASAADHSNFVIVCRRMIIEASAADLEQFYVVESQRWPCRITGIYADVAALSPDMQDIYLDRFKWLNNSWPLNARHHIDMLTDRLVRSRSRYVTDLLHDCGHAARMSPEMILTLQSKWMLASPGAQYRFAQHLVETLREGLLFEVNQAEVFAPSIVESHGAEVIRDFRTFLG